MVVSYFLQVIQGGRFETVNNIFANVKCFMVSRRILILFVKEVTHADTRDRMRQTFASEIEEMESTELSLKPNSGQRSMKEV